MTEQYYVICVDLAGHTSNSLEDVIKDVIYESCSKSPYNPFVTKVLNHKKIKGSCVYDGCDCGERCVNRQIINTSIRRYFFIANAQTTADAIAKIAEDYNMKCIINPYRQGQVVDDHQNFLR